jgi:hypothetical protein
LVSLFWGRGIDETYKETTQPEKEERENLKKLHVS